MKFVIVGYGRVGMRTTDILVNEGHDVVIVDVDSEKAQQARDAGLEVIEGDGEDERVLERADLDETDALAALSGDLNVNFTACMIANGHGCRTVLRIDEDYRQEIYEKYAADVDEVVYPERMGAAGAKTALLGGNLNVLADLTEHLTATSIDIPSESPVIGQRVVELDLPGNARLYAHGRRKEPMTIPLPQTRIEAGDRVALIAEQSSLESVQTMLTG
ncbi:TrkA family potassium uptake protein [Natronomonas gomsonensis]|jgi:trk system potassium uptake protein TrkA|uniref:potassium channel family protein n=1 Tax=Natronomonas gomsonensis TaxID=1046043 RepID=UPI0020CA7C0A|nr:TrkA family potassium uptake protein [Natronomonas gomsonensis]MCY4730975.1 TrkA family potassium uptake protein [Natronomonas gomsonensis]